MNYTHYAVEKILYSIHNELYHRTKMLNAANVSSDTRIGYMGAIIDAMETIKNKIDTIREDNKQ